MPDQFEQLENYLFEAKIDLAISDAIRDFKVNEVLEFIAINDAIDALTTFIDNDCRNTLG